MIQKDGKIYRDMDESKELLSRWIREDAQVLAREMKHLKKQTHELTV